MLDTTEQLNTCTLKIPFSSKDPYPLIPKIRNFGMLLDLFPLPTLYGVCTQSCLILCSPMDCNPRGSSVLEFCRQECWSGLPFLPPGHFPTLYVQIHFHSLPILPHMHHLNSSTSFHCHQPSPRHLISSLEYNSLLTGLH